MVLDLISELPEATAYDLYFDNFFTSIPLLEKLSEKGKVALAQLERIGFANAHYVTCQRLDVDSMTIDLRVPVATVAHLLSPGRTTVS